MYFIIELDFSGLQTYVKTLIEAAVQAHQVDVDVVQEKNKIVLVCNRDDAAIEAFLQALESLLPASLFLGKSRHYFSDEKPVFTLAADATTTLLPPAMHVARNIRLLRHILSSVNIRL